MHRKKSNKSRLANTDEQKHMQWIKERQKCAACDTRGPVINHHIWGATKKVKVDLVTVHIGHAAVIGLCPECDWVDTHRSHRAFREMFGPPAQLWLRQYEDSPVRFPDEVVRGISECVR